MSADHDIAQWLTASGFGAKESRELARGALEEAGLTRPGKLRLSDEKLPRARELLERTFALHCESPECLAWANASGRTPVRCDPKASCGLCGGSTNLRAEKSLLEACERFGVKRLVIVGGSPAVREELERGLGRTLALRMVDGTERRTADRARSDLEWADLVLVWGATELHHKVSWLYTQSAPHKHKVVHVARRGIAALLEAAVQHFHKRASLP